MDDIQKLEKQERKIKEREERERPDRITYTEVILVEPLLDYKKNDEKNICILPTHVSRDFFEEKLKMIQKKKCPYRFFKRKFRTYIHQNIYLICHENKENDTMEVFEKSMLKYVCEKEKNIIHIGFAKRKQPFHVFPSTTDLNDITLTKRLTFLINSYIYINFDIYFPLHENQKFDPTYALYKIFINVNSEKNIDIDHTRSLVQEALSFLEY